MENRKCLHCGKDLTETDILQFNKFCSVECLNEHREKLMSSGMVSPTKIEKEFDLIKNVAQLETNIRTLDIAAHDQSPIFIGRRSAIGLICGGRRFVPYTIGNSKEIHTAPSKFIGYVANSLEVHLRVRDGRHGQHTNDAIDALNFGSFTLGPRLSHDELLKAHITYCESFKTYPKPTFGSIYSITFWPFIILPEP